MVYDVYPSGITGPEVGAQWGYTCAIVFGVVSAVRYVYIGIAFLIDGTILVIYDTFLGDYTAANLTL